mmetsp:Transcript_26007/g.80992  ORF Transcript_26007/g.80992 Transcript_26007/m.80992 type:complete len:285 (+) Transcript_26007:252-1106(+)
MLALLAPVDRENPPKLAYGTAGFRTEASRLIVAMERVGMLAGARSAEKGGAAVGVMITASHNPVQDNGVKIVDPTGAMLAADWEPKAEALARAPASKLADALAAVSTAKGPAIVVVGRDTRPHSRALQARVVAGARALGAEVVDVGVVTTPQLHHCVRARNGFEEPPPGPLHGYAEGLAVAFEALVRDPGPPRGAFDTLVLSFVAALFRERPVDVSATSRRQGPVPRRSRRASTRPAALTRRSSSTARVASASTRSRASSGGSRPRASRRCSRCARRTGPARRR